MPEQQLRRDLGLTQAITTVIGIVIGSGIFAVPAVVFARATAPGLGLAAWLLSGLITITTGLTVAELTAAMPKAGGTYVFLKAAYGDWMGFLQGWASFLAYNSAICAALAVISTTYLTSLVPLSATAQTLVSLGFIAIFTGVNIVGVRFGGLVQAVATIAKLVPIALLILFGLPHVTMANLTPFLPVEQGLWVALAGAMLPTLYAFDGWMHVGMIAEEIRNPQRNLPLAIVGGLGVTTLIYLLFNGVLIGAVPIAQVTATEMPVLPLASQLFGSAGSKLIAVGMLVSMLGTLNGMTLTAPRYYFAMARDGLFPGARLVARLHPRFSTPVAALGISALWSAVLVLWGGFDQLLNLIVFVSWIFNVLTMVAVLVLRHTQPQLHRPYRVLGYPIVPLIGIAAGLWILWSSLVTSPGTALLGLGLTATGLPVY